MDVSVSGSAARPLSYDMFADLTTATVTEFVATQEGVTISFDGDVSAVQDQIRARTLSPNTNAETLRAKAANALATNVNYRALAAPTSAQAIAQVDVLTSECSALIRLLLGLLDSTAGT